MLRMTNRVPGYSRRQRERCSPASLRPENQSLTKTSGVVCRQDLLDRMGVARITADLEIPFRPDEHLQPGQRDGMVVGYGYSDYLHRSAA